MSYRAGATLIRETLHRSLWLQAVSGIQPGPTSVEKFQQLSGITSARLARTVLRELAINAIGSQELLQGRRGRSVLYGFSNADRLGTSILAIQNGCDIERVSALLTWKDFEGLASQALADAGYKTITNLRFKTPRMEIDVVGSLNGLAIAVDCKHWSRRNASSIRAFCEKQRARCSRLVDVAQQIPLNSSRKNFIRRALPVLLTLFPERCKMIEGVPVIPISQFRSFVLDIDTIAEDFFVTASQ